MELTEIGFSVTPAFPPPVHLLLWTMLEWLMPITYIIEEVNLILAGEKRCCNAVDRCITPALQMRLLIKRTGEKETKQPHSRILPSRRDK
jgi:hypothetical protein